MIKIEILESLLPFSSLKPKTLAATARRAYQRKITAGCTLLVEGMAAESCYFVVSGQLRVVKMNKDGRIQILARLGEGDPINIISLLQEQRINRATVESLSSSTLLVIPADDFNQLLTNFPDFSIMLLRIFADRMVRMTDLAADLSLYTVRARLAQFLMALADNPQSAGGWTQDEIAAQIGTVRDVVGRLLREFESQGLISRERHQISLIDREALISEAQNDKI